MAKRKYISLELQQRIREQFADSCAYCLSPRTLIPVSYEFDHIVPVAVGGETTFENLCLACPSCNSYKGSQQTALDPETGSVVNLFHPQQDSWHDHFSWSDDGATVVAHTPSARATIVQLNLNRSLLVELRRLWVSLGVFSPASKTK